MAISRRRAEGPEQTSTGAPSQCRLWLAFPTLLEFLTETRYEDGAARVLPTLTLFCEPGGLKACLNDRDQELVTFITSASLTGLLEALEEGLRDGGLTWRQSVVKTKPGRKSA